jgi:uncharacterized FAD-dependent dehydrogenase
MTKKYDVIIFGSGPAGIFASLEITRESKLQVLLIEKGEDLGERVCPSRITAKPCISCIPYNMVCGLGGAGAFSDGKLTLTPEVGGWLKERAIVEGNLIDLQYRSLGYLLVKWQAHLFVSSARLNGGQMVIKWSIRSGKLI